MGSQVLKSYAAHFDNADDDKMRLPYAFAFMYENVRLQANLSLPSCRRCAAKGVECSYLTVTPVPPPPSASGSPLLSDSIDHVLLSLRIPFFTSTTEAYSIELDFIEHDPSTSNDYTARAEFLAHTMSLQSTALADKGFNVSIHSSPTLASDALRDALAGSALLAAEHDNFVLQVWASRLQSSLSCDDDLVEASWETWVEQEAIRRTLMCIELAQGTYTYLRGSWPIGLRCNHDLRFNAQKALWEAKSAAEWRLVCDDFVHPSMPCNMIRLNKDIRNAMPCDLDDLGVLWHAAGQGLAGMNTWLRHDKEALQRWGQVDV
ncbi:hypothetical protein F52700_9705 [Fusarium sp. NRRL 52700]|nr:hypothetical protein F52700_9705 [Fusarium sp. NRRL 52700]